MTAFHCSAMDYARRTGLLEKTETEQHPTIIPEDHQIKPGNATDLDPETASDPPDA